MYKKLSFIVPVYNEEKTLNKVLNDILKTGMEIDKEIVVIDDASTDKTKSILENFKSEKNIKILRNSNNMGKSLSVKRGILNSSGDLVVIHDSDLEYNTDDLIRFVELFNKSDADIIYGNRFAKKFKIVYPVIWFGNVSLTAISGLITGLRAGMWVRDAHVCYKMVRGEIMRNIGEKLVSTSGFGFDTEVTARLSKFKMNGKHLKFAQIPVSYSPRTMRQGKKLRPISDGLRALEEIFRFNFFVK